MDARSLKLIPIDRCVPCGCFAFYVRRVVDGKKKKEVKWEVQVSSDRHTLSLFELIEDLRYQVLHLHQSELQVINFNTKYLHLPFMIPFDMLS